MSIEPILNIAIELPEKGSRDLLRSLHRQLRAAIVDGRLQAGVRLPPTRALAKALGVSRNTAIAAYDLLLSEGYVEARSGAGTFVTDLRPRLIRPKAPPPDPEADTRLAPQWRGWRPVKEFCSDQEFRYDFIAGVPDMNFPFDIWQRLSTRAARLVARRKVQERDPAGDYVLREAIANHVSFVRAVACTPDDIVVTGGTRQAIDLIARILVTPGQTEAAIEDPGYGPTRRSLEAVGATILPIPVDAEGLNIGDRIIVGNERVIAQSCVEHTEQTRRFRCIPLHRVGNVLGGVDEEMTGLTSHGPQTANLPEQPLQDDLPLPRCARH